MKIIECKTLQIGVDVDFENDDFEAGDEDDHDVTLDATRAIDNCLVVQNIINVERREYETTIGMQRLPVISTDTEAYIVMAGPSFEEIVKTIKLA